jgi:Domain of Unknown Function (DUF928)
MRFIPQLLWAMTGTIALTSLPELTHLASEQISGKSFETAIFSTAIAQARSIRYVPPGRRGAPTRTQGGGSRNCGSEVTPVTLLAPPDHVGLTTQGRPKLLWYSVSDSMLPMQFSIVEPGMSEPVWSQELPEAKAGLNEIQLPDNVPELVVGRRYRWNISRLCSIRRNTDSTVVRGWIERVVANPIQAQLNAKMSLEERVNAYAEAGLWYDAIAQAASTPAGKAPESTVSPLVLTLLEQGGIKIVLQQEQKRAKRGTPRHDPGSDLKASKGR